jgi:predicted site-specific integrase-resolvase
MRSNEILRPSEAADYLGVAMSTLAAWRVRSQGPIFIKCGCAVRYDLDDLKDWVSKRKRHNTSHEGQ